ncbi:MAG: hypothetical protein CVU63_23315, partial [Deltaproteobacteria bacterium HGW-Deltaproteobacteria-20]
MLDQAAAMMLRRLLFTLLTVLILFVSARPARAAVIERVVAVVGDQAILMSELRQRARPFLLEIHTKMPTEAQRAAAESEMLRQMLQRMIDDQLEAQAAAKLRIRVEAEEIDKAIARLARMQEISVEDLMSEVLRSGMTAQEYRSEIRRQLLEAGRRRIEIIGKAAEPFQLPVREAVGSRHSEKAGKARSLERFLSFRSGRCRRATRRSLLVRGDRQQLGQPRTSR